MERVFEHLGYHFILHPVLSEIANVLSKNVLLREADGAFVIELLEVGLGVGHDLLLAEIAGRRGGEDLLVVTRLVGL